jgi:two-component system nitrogen regulation response regulator GlnG
MSHVLIIDDEQSVCWGLERLLTEEGYEVTVCPSAEEGLAAVRRRRPDLALVDVRLPGIDGLTALERLRAEDPFPVVIITAYGSLDTAVQALQRGAFDYLTKPFELEQVVDVVRRAESSIRDMRRAAEGPPIVVGDDLLLGTSPPMQEVFKRIALAAPTDAPVLVVGESGTGKELVARALHRHSRSAAGPFVAIHAAALSPTLVESELFGHVRGSFTGADADRRGLLESAHGGTVFLDEAADIPLAVQVKLLRVLERHEIVRIGESQPRPCRIRIVAAVNRDPAECVREGLLRKDLLYRLAAFDIRLPPLGERRGDVPLLAEHFLRAAAQGRDAELHFSAAAVEELVRRSWPGNVRELRNAVEHAAITARGGRIEPHHFPPAGRYETASPTDAAGTLRAAVAAWAEHRLTSGEPTAALHDRLLDVCEPPLFEAVLRATDGNRAAAADVLGIHRATLRKKLNEPRASDES